MPLQEIRCPSLDAPQSYNGAMERGKGRPLFNRCNSAVEHGAVEHGTARLRGRQGAVTVLAQVDFRSR
jgi:hypothetical protein